MWLVKRFGKKCDWHNLVAGIIYGLEWLLPADPEEMLIDNMYIYGVVAGLVAYALGRSRRNAFVSCLFGITFAQLVQWIINMAKDTPSILGLGVGGAFGAYVVAIVIAVAVSEFVGRCVECAIGKENKEYNFETHTFDSEKNGKLEVVQTSNGKKVKNVAKIKNANNIKNKRNSTSNAQNNAKLQKEGGV